jgi:hypothetical protein
MAALDALQRYNGFKQFHLVGQSGGGHTVAGLVQLRSDIGRAVITSASHSLRSALWTRGHPPVGKHRFYDPIDHVNTMRRRPGLRLFVVSDRKDKIVSYRSQLEFVERVKAHNLPITRVTATAADKDSHGLFAHGHQLADNCAHDAWEAEEVERAWAVSKDTTTIAVLEEFVRRYGDSHYAALARARMEELGKSQAEAAPPLVPPQPSVAATIVPKRVKTVTIRTEIASRPTQSASSGALTASTRHGLEMIADSVDVPILDKGRIWLQHMPSIAHESDQALAAMADLRALTPRYLRPDLRERGQSGQ